MWPCDQVLANRMWLEDMHVTFGSSPWKKYSLTFAFSLSQWLDYLWPCRRGQCFGDAKEPGSLPTWSAFQTRSSCMDGFIRNKVQYCLSPCIFGRYRSPGFILINPYAPCYKIRSSFLMKFVLKQRPWWSLMLIIQRIMEFESLTGNVCRQKPGWQIMTTIFELHRL